MDYYARRQKTISIIDKMVELGSYSQEQIEMAILRETGLSKRFVNSYVVGMTGLGKFKVTEKGEVVNV